MPASWSLNLGSQGLDFLICKMGIVAPLCDVFHAKKTRFSEGLHLPRPPGVK